MDLIIKLVKGIDITDQDLENELYQICDRVHSSCDSECPVYYLNNNEAPNTLPKNRGCDCFKNGRYMLEFIKTKV